jgi:endonuclease/exonuclease/phosphatase family metal-dependent hydrolase
MAGTPAQAKKYNARARAGWVIVIVLAGGATLGGVAWWRHHECQLLLKTQRAARQKSATEPVPASPPASEPKSFKLITWNIQYGRDKGSDPNGWPQRKKALAAALAAEKPEVLCVQEALAGQLEFLDGQLPGYARVGVGREDGKQKGEHAAIYYDEKRFKSSTGGTFWLSDTPGKPSRSWGNQYTRICTWVRLEDMDSKRSFRVYNAHFALNAAARQKSAALIARRIAEEKGALPTILVGDFNCGPGSAPWKTFRKAGLTDAAKLAGRPVGTATFQKYGFGLVCLDAIFVSKGFAAASHRVITGQRGKTFPSDHFAVAAELKLSSAARNSATPKARPATQTFRVLTYNVQKGTPARKIAADLAKARADVLCLQELDRDTKRSGKEDQIALLKKALDMKGVYVASYKVDGGTTGMGILSRFPIEGAAPIKLKKSRDIGVRATVKLPQGAVTVFSVHLASTYKFDLTHLAETRAMRSREATRLITLIKGCQGPVILAGDFNCALDSDLMPRFAARLTDATSAVKGTYPATAPLTKIDYVLVRGLKAVKSRLMPAGSSDHRGVVCELSFPE